MSIFRKESLDTLENPGQITDYVKVTTPPLYIMQMAMVVCCVVVMLWVAFGTVTEHVQSVAVVFAHNKPTKQSAPSDGQVEQIFVPKGTFLAKGEPILSVRINDGIDTVRASVGGILISTKEPDETFRAYETLAEIVAEKRNAYNRELITFVDYKDLRKLRVGQEVQITPVDLHREDYGYVKGHITEVNLFPGREDYAERMSVVKNFVDNIFPAGTAYEVKLVADVADNDSTRLQWSRKQSSDIHLGRMSFCNVQIITERKPIYKMLFRY